MRKASLALIAVVVAVVGAALYFFTRKPVPTGVAPAAGAARPSVLQPGADPLAQQLAAAGGLVTALGGLELF